MTIVLPLYPDFISDALASSQTEDYRYLLNAIMEAERD